VLTAIARPRYEGTVYNMTSDGRAVSLNTTAIPPVIGGWALDKQNWRWVVPVPRRGRPATQRGRCVVRYGAAHTTSPWYNAKSADGLRGKRPMGSTLLIGNAWSEARRKALKDGGSRRFPKPLPKLRAG